MAKIFRHPFTRKLNVIGGYNVAYGGKNALPILESQFQDAAAGGGGATTSARFDASTDGLARTTGVFDPELNFTWAGWFRLAANNSTSYQTIAIVYCGGAAWDALYLDASRNFSVDVNGSAASTGDVLTIGTWYHVAMRRTSTTALEVYLNGTLTYTATTSAAGRSAPSAMYLGKEEFGTWVDGNFAFWRLWKWHLHPLKLKRSARQPMRSGLRICMQIGTCRRMQAISLAMDEDGPSKGQSPIRKLVQISAAEAQIYCHCLAAWCRRAQ